MENNEKCKEDLMVKKIEAQNEALKNLLHNVEKKSIKKNIKNTNS